MLCNTVFMRVIPVMDLWRGQVVHAVRGDRQAYRPIVSTLCDGSDPPTLARALCGLCRHDAPGPLYVADLDALSGGEPQAEVLRRILQALPEVSLWVDAGFADRTAADALRDRIGPAAARLVPVFGSESLRSRAALQACFAGRHDDGVLSLDRRDGQRLDPAGCWDAPACWPHQVIAMTLERVGADSGPDLGTLRGLHALSPATRFIGAGGIRDASDLQRACDAGAWAWLVASALHAGRLPHSGGLFS
jgi:uncharacterized protein related to proFAR isomerase